MSYELYCPNCENILDITKSIPKKIKIKEQNIKTPSHVSNDEDSDSSNSSDSDSEQLSDIIKKIVKDETITNDELDILKNTKLSEIKEFQELDKNKKNLVQEKLTEKLDNNISAHWICKNCLFTKPIDKGTQILSRISSEITTISSVSTSENLDKFKNKAYSKILPLTRNYNCVNKNCDTYKKNVPKEAVFYRIYGTMQTWYTCRICNNYWKNE